MVWLMGLQTWFGWWVGLQTWFGWWVYKHGLAGGLVYKLGLAGGFTNMVWLVGLQTSPTVPSPPSKISRTVTDLPPKKSSTAPTTMRLRNKITSVPFIAQRKGLFYIHTCLERTKRSFYSHPSRENEWIVLHSHLSKENESIVQHSHLSRENKSIVLHSHLSRENERKSRERRYRPPVVHQIRVPPTLRHTHS